MRNIKFAMLGGIVSCSLLADNVSAAIFFSDGFENATTPLTSPDIGRPYQDSSTGTGVLLTTTPGQVDKGTTSLKLNRTNDGANSPNLRGNGNPGALVPGNVVDYSFDINTLANSVDGTTHAFNNPIQFTLGFSDGRRLARIGTLDGGSEAYSASNDKTGVFGTFAQSSVLIPRNTIPYDTVRAEFNLTSPSAGTIGGTYSLFVSTDGGPEQLALSNLALATVPITTDDAPSFLLQRGPFTSDVYVDQISISTPTTVPEPASLALAGMTGGLLLSRRRRA